MKVVILAGGLGTRLMELTKITPKPMVEIGGIPILMHIMNRYIDCIHDLQYVVDTKQSLSKIFGRFVASSSIDFEISPTGSNWEQMNSSSRSFKVKVIDTGESTLTGAD